MSTDISEMEVEFLFENKQRDTLSKQASDISSHTCTSQDRLAQNCHRTNMRLLDSMYNTKCHCHMYLEFR